MYSVALFPVPSLADGDVDGTLGRALDADHPDGRRVQALHALRGAPAGMQQALARRLVAVLNEPVHWVASEALLCIAAIAPGLPLAVDERGLFIADDTEPHGLVDDGAHLYSPRRGLVTLPWDVGAHPHAPQLPWLARHAGSALLCVDGVHLAFPRGRPLVVGADAAADLRVSHGARALVHLRADDAVVTIESTATDARVDGAAFGGAITAKRLSARSVLEIGGSVIRLLHIHPSERPALGAVRVTTDPRQVLRLETPRVSVGDALRLDLGTPAHAVALGREEIAVVSPTAAARVTAAACERGPVVVGPFTVSLSANTGPLLDDDSEEESSDEGGHGYDEPPPERQFNIRDRVEA